MAETLKVTTPDVDEPPVDREAIDPMWSPALHAIPVPGIRKMINMASTMENVVHLSLGQPDVPTPPHVIEAHIEALRRGLTGYTMDAGLPELLTALAAYYGKRYDRPDLTEDNFLVTAGATEGMYLALTATATPGRQFLVPEPTYVTYGPLIRMNGGEVKVIPTRAENGYQLDPDEVIANIGMRTYGIVLNSPNNPSGAVYPRETIEAIISEAAYRGIRVFSDEVYDHLILDDMEYPSVIRCTTELDHVIAVSSLSKTFSMPGLRVGWIISSQGVIRRLRRLHMFTTTVANTPAQWAGVAALTGDQSCLEAMVRTYAQRRERVVKLVGDTSALTGYWPQAGFFVFPSLPPKVDASLLAMRMLKEIGVCVVPGDAFGESCQHALRISYSTSMDQIEEAFSRMIPWLDAQEF